jgi:hypothetical protein
MGYRRDDFLATPAAQARMRDARTRIGRRLAAFRDSMLVDALVRLDSLRPLTRAGTALLPRDSSRAIYVVDRQPNTWRLARLTLTPHDTLVAAYDSNTFDYGAHVCLAKSGLVRQAGAAGDTVNKSRRLPNDR